MPDKKLRCFIKFTTYLYVLFGIFLFSLPLYSQDFEDQPVFEEQEPPGEADSPENTPNADETSVTDENSTITTDPVEEQGAPPPAVMSENGNNGDFDVFQPSEEISEDLAVPFPADI